jgi:peptidylprolyl isomerase
MSLQVTHTQEGTGPLCPSGAKVTMHYTGKLENGSVFDSSVTRGTPFECTIGVGQVIKGWDQGVPQMKKGGKATFTIPASLGYGAQGAGGVIPPNATLIFDVELLDFK